VPKKGKKKNHPRPGKIVIRAPGGNLIRKSIGTGVTKDRQEDKGGRDRNCDIKKRKVISSIAPSSRIKMQPLEGATSRGRADSGVRASGGGNEAWVSAAKKITRGSRAGGEIPSVTPEMGREKGM